MKASDYFIVGDRVVLCNLPKDLSEYNGSIATVTGYKLGRSGEYEILAVDKIVGVETGWHPMYVQLCDEDGKIYHHLAHPWQHLNDWK